LTGRIKKQLVVQTTVAINLTSTNCT